MFADGEIKYKVGIDSSELSKLKSVGAGVFKGLAVGATATATALGGLVMKSVQMSGELEQQLGGSQAVFEKFAETVQKKGAEAYKVMGLSQNEYLATANKMGSLMQGAGLSVGKSMDLSTKAMQRAADVASVMGVDVSFAMESIAGAAKGNFTMMDNLGVAMNDTTLQAYALEKGIDKSTQAMTNAEKVELAMQMFLEKTSKYAGNYAKENETFAGSFTTLKASIQNFLSGAGDIDSVIESTMDFADILVRSIEEMAPQLVEGIIKLVNGIIPRLPELLSKLLPVIINGAIDLMNGLIQALPQLLPILLNGVIQLFMGLIPMLPQIISLLLQGLIMIMNALAQELPTMLPQIIDAILALIPMLIDNLPLLIEAGITLLIALLSGIIQATPTLLKYIPKIVFSIIKALAKLPILLAKAGFNAILSLARAIINNIFRVASAAKNIGSKIINTIKELLKPGKLADIGKNLVEGLWNGIKNAKDWVLGKIKGFGESILNGIKDIFDINSPSKEFAWIGKMNIIGLEKGMEDNIPSLNSTIEKTIELGYDTSGLEYLKNGASNYSASVLSESSGFSSEKAQPIYVTVNADMDVNKFGKAFVRDIKTFSGGAKNSYNYGGGK